jgi:hypothetical protein
MNQSLPRSKSSETPNARQKFKRVVEELGLCGLANDTKWDEFISAMRVRPWHPSYRCKCVGGPVSDWDAEWYYHLPLPMLSVYWLDVMYLQKVADNCLPPRTEIVDHSSWIEDILEKAGLDYLKGEKMIRIFGYSPKDLTLFDQ